MSSVVSALRLLPAGVALWGAIWKFADPVRSVMALSKLLGLSTPAALRLMFALIATELMLGLLLIPGSFPKVVLPTTAAFFATLGIGVVILLARGKSGQPCGCGDVKTKRLSPSLAVQNIALALIAAAETSGASGPITEVILFVGVFAFLGATTVAIVQRPREVDGDTAHNDTARIDLPLRRVDSISTSRPTKADVGS
jgi:hypothetical protein